MFSLEGDKMTALGPNESLTFTFYEKLSTNIPYWTTFVKEVLESMFSLISYVMTALGPNDSLTFTFYVIFSNGIPNITTFVKEFFDSMFSLKSDKIKRLSDQMTT